jgi:hypothetical protein
LKPNETEGRYGRIAGLVDLDALAPKRVTIIGAGSMGGPVAVQLGRHGVGTRGAGRLRVIDGDVVSERNLIGTDYRLQHVGMPKAEALAAIIRECNDQVNVSYWNKMLTEGDVGAVVGLARQSDLLGLFADGFDIMLRIADACSEVCAQVMAVFGPRADYAEVAFSLPGATPPLSWTLGKRRRQTIAKPEALGCDTVWVASFVAALCIRLLLGEAKGSELLPCYTNTPVLLAGVRKSWVFENQPPDVARSIVLVQAEKPAKGERR